MDHYRTSFIKAQEVADEIILMKKNQFLNSMSDGSIMLDTSAYIPAIRQWYQLKGFRWGTDEASTQRALKQAVAEWFRSSNGSGYSSAFILSNDSDHTRLFYATGNSLDMQMVLKSKIPEAEVDSVEWSGKACAYNGILSGSLSAAHLSDTVMGMQIKDSYVACVVVPTSDEEVFEKIAENEQMIACLNQYKSFQRTYGKASRRVEEIPIPSVIRAVTLLKEENEYLQQNLGRGFVRSVIRFGASDAEDYSRLATVIRGAMNHDYEEQAGYEPIRCVELRGRHQSWRECLAIPYVNIDAYRCSRGVHLVSWQSLENIVDFCMPPMNSHQGFYVKNYRVDENAVDVFPLTKPVSEPGIVLGKIKNHSMDAMIPFSALHAHMFITGATETGKTTTIKKLISKLYVRGIPFTVIEAAKKEYISLLAQVPELQIYTSGADGHKLMINPFQPEDGTLIENHANAVARAIIAANGGEHPIPEALEGVIQQAYEKAGWYYGALAYTDEKKPFPTIKDVFDNIPEYIEKHAQYGPEVKKNLEAALTIRAKNMKDGALGRLFENPFGLSAKELLETPAVIELADFAETSASFLMNILLYKFHSYLSRLPENRDLKRVIVVEEAHNVFRKTMLEESGRALNNNYFERMLAEIRSSGTGLILSDQRPEIMSEAVIANTTVKIVHGLGADSDRNMMGEAMNMSDFQIRRMYEFGKGECIIGIRGRYGVQHVMVDALPTEEVMNGACHICGCRFRCRKRAIQNMIRNIDAAKLRFHIFRICADPYNPQKLVLNINHMLKDLNISAADSTKICLLGEILKSYSMVSYQESRIIVNSYAEYLRRCA